MSTATELFAMKSLQSKITLDPCLIFMENGNLGEYYYSMILSQFKVPTFQESDSMIISIVLIFNIKIEI